MSYIVVPFVASIANNGTAGQAAEQLQQLIEQHTQRGYRYVRLEQVTTTVAGTNGCFGLGATPATVRSLSMVVFEAAATPPTTVVPLLGGASLS
jgi:hypothetical protein